ncbi:MAG: hypothetical protein HY430_00795 [Candidatus Levybacteria bacterium]|nr:hypothetical protein [Candidatus Levybacteria bacterium]
MQPNKPRELEQLILIDGNAILHRALHALPELTNPTGEPVQAVYGFFSMLFSVIDTVGPEYLIVCFDRPKPTFRKQLYVGYQAHRPAAPEGFGAQIGYVHELLEKMKVTVFEVDGYEADDVIGTLSVQAVAKYPDVEVFIVTGDRDLLQLVNGRVKVIAPVVGLKETVTYDAKKVEEKFGVKPSQFIDYKALIGDASDGYPGVAGIGPKTASNLLLEFGTFEDLYERIADVPPKIAEKLATDAEQAALAKKLATIMTDVPIELDLSVCACTSFDMIALSDGFAKLGFNSLMKRIAPKVKKQQEEKEGKQLGLL